MSKSIRGKKEKWELFKNTESIIDTKMLSNGHIEIFGNCKISLEGCLSVSEYRDTYVKLKMQKGVIILCGSDFDIVSFENKSITIKGVISSIEFSF